MSYEMINNKLSDVLILNGYKNESEQLAFIKLLAYSQAFDNPLLHINEQLNQQLIMSAKAAYNIWKQLGLLEVYENHKSHIISDEQAKYFLNLEFPNLEEGYYWLFHITQLKFLRPTFYDEGLGPQKEKLAINTSQWNVTDEMFIAETEALEFLHPSYQLYKCIKALHLTDSTSWPRDKTVKNVVFISSLAEYVKVRINELQSFTGKLYFVSGIRGLFPYEEECLVEILLEWFEITEEEYQEKKQTLKSILETHRDFHDPKNWTQNLIGLKQEILYALGKIAWCNAENKSWYYKNPEIFEEQSRINGRESLKDWPVAMDMFEYYFKKHSKQYPGKFDSVILEQVLVVGKNEKLPTTEDFINDWYQKFHDKLELDGGVCVFIACNATHRLGLVMQNIVIAQALQDYILQQTITNKLKKFNNKSSDSDKLLSFEKNFFLVGAPAKKWSLTRCLDVIARRVSLLLPILLNKIEEYQNIEENFKNYVPIKNLDYQIFCIKQMNFYRRKEQYISLVYAAIHLAFNFYFLHDYVKTSGLFCFSKDVLKKIYKNSSIIIEMLENACLNNIRDFIVFSNFFKFNSIVDVSLDFLKEQDRLNKEFLSNIRCYLKNDFIKITYNNKNDIIHFYKKCYREMQSFFSMLIRQTVKSYNYFSFKILFSSLGSTSRKQGTPYSDIEFFALIDDVPNSLIYAKEITKLFLLKIINLGETILRSYGISAYDLQGREYHLKDNSFDVFTPRGISLDFNDPQAACKTPLGAKVNGNVLYRLIGTPACLAQLSGLEGLKKDFELPGLLRYSIPFCGNRGLFWKFQKELNKQLYTKNFNFIEYSINILKKDIDKYIVYLNELEKLKRINHKNYFYRQIVLIIDDLFMLLSPNKNTDSFKKINCLFEYKFISLEQKELLEGTLQLVLFIRMQQHFLFKQNKFDIIFKEKTEIKLKVKLLELKNYFLSIKNDIDCKGNFFCNAVDIAASCLFSKSFHSFFYNANSSSELVIASSMCQRTI